MARCLVVDFVLDIWALTHPKFSSEKIHIPVVNGSTGTYGIRLQKYRIYLQKTAWSFGLSRGKLVKFA